MRADAIRSLLFVPADREALALKALASEADAVILDLEDAVAPDAKAAAREVARGVLDTVDRSGKAVFVRINALGTGLELADLAAVVGGGPWGIVLPKAGGAADIARLSLYLDALEARDGLEAGSTRILTVATETAAATLALGDAGPSVAARLWGEMWGAEDLAAALGAQANRDDEGCYTWPYQHARSQCLYGANARGVSPVDAVFPAFRDLDGLEREVREAARDGFVAKAAIHPAQIEVIHRWLTPTSESIDRAHRIVTALTEVGVARLDGAMIDLAHKRNAERILARATALGVA